MSDRINIHLRDLGRSFVTRQRGKEAFEKIKQITRDLNSDNLIVINYEENDLISFSFIDELLQRSSEEIKQRIIFLIPEGEKSSLYRKLSRFAGLRGVDVEYIASPDGKPSKVIPSKPMTLPTPEYKGKPV